MKIIGNIVSPDEMNKNYSVKQILKDIPHQPCGISQNDRNPGYSIIPYIIRRARSFDLHAINRAIRFLHHFFSVLMSEKSASYGSRTAEKKVELGLLRGSLHTIEI